MRQISKRKPRFKVLRQVSLYEDTIGPIISHTRINNDAEAPPIKKALRRVNQVVFQNFLSDLRKIPPKSDSPWEMVIQYDDSVSALRTRYNSFENKISKLKPYFEEYEASN